MAFIKSLQLHAFRNYRDSVLSDMHEGFIVLTGHNGAGKTNILEAISLLTPGRGMRAAKFVELRNREAAAHINWAITSDIESPVGLVRIGTGMKLVNHTERRIARVNGVDLKTQADLSDYLSCVWLTPQMDRLFIDATSDRRRFFDRLVYAFDPAHAGRISRYESVLSQRAKLLREQQMQNTTADPIWLASLEATMAQTGVAIAAARLQTIENLSSHIDTILKNTSFPTSTLSLSGGIEESLKTSPALEVEDRMRERLALTRKFDSEHGSASVGPHRTDLQVTYADKNMPASLCSTGEQKALLTGIILAHAVRTKEIRAVAPILLLDEIAAHLDTNRRETLFQILHDLRAQVFITGTDDAIFQSLKGARHMLITNDTIKEAA